MAEKIFGPGSFTAGIGGETPQAQNSEVAQGPNGGIQGGATGLTALAPGGEFEKQAQIDQADLDAIWSLGAKMSEEKLQEKQMEQFVYGMSRAARGDTMEKIKKDVPFWARAFGNKVVEGGRFLTAATESTREQQNLRDTMKETENLTPAEADKLFKGRMIDNVLKNKDLDPITQAMILEKNTKALPDLMATHQSRWYRNIQAESASNRQQFMISQVDSIRQVKSEITAGNISREMGQSQIDNIVGSMGRMEGETSESYTQGMQAAVEYGISVGDGSLTNFMTDPATAKDLRPEERIALAGKKVSMERQGMANYLVTEEGSMAHNVSLAKIAAAPLGERGNVARAQHEEMKLRTGLGSDVSQWFDIGKIEGASFAEKQQGEQAAQKAAVSFQIKKLIQDASALPLGSPIGVQMGQQAAQLAQQNIGLLGTEEAGQHMLAADKLASANVIQDGTNRAEAKAKEDAEAMRGANDVATKEGRKAQGLVAAAQVIAGGSGSIDDVMAAAKAGGAETEDVNAWLKVQVAAELNPANAEKIPDSEVPKGMEKHGYNLVKVAGKWALTEERGEAKLPNEVREKVYLTRAAQNFVESGDEWNVGLDALVKGSRTNQSLKNTLVSLWGIGKYKYIDTFSRQIAVTQDVAKSRQEAGLAMIAPANAKPKGTPLLVPGAKGANQRIIDMQGAAQEHGLGYQYMNPTSVSSQRIFAEVNTFTEAAANGTDEEYGTSQQTVLGFKAADQRWVRGINTALELPTDEQGKPVDTLRSFLTANKVPFQPNKKEDMQRLDNAIASSVIGTLLATPQGAGKTFYHEDGKIITDDGKVVVDLAKIPPIKGAKNGFNTNYSFKYASPDPEGQGTEVVTLSFNTDYIGNNYIQNVDLKRPSWITRKAQDWAEFGSDVSTQVTK